MQINQSETIIILGDSPFIETIQNKVSYLLDRYFSIGINRVVESFNTSYHIFIDIGLIPITNRHPAIPTISLYKYGDLIQKERKELLEIYSFNIKKNTKEDILKDGKLAYCGFTHDFAISYCISKGWKNIVLVGAADFIQGDHFTSKEQFSPSELLIEKSKRFIENICTKKANIFTINPHSLLNVPYMDINSLLT